MPRIRRSISTSSRRADPQPTLDNLENLTTGYAATTYNCHLPAQEELLSLVFAPLRDPLLQFQTLQT